MLSTLNHTISLDKKEEEDIFQKYYSI